VKENKQELKAACFGQKSDFEPNTHARHQGITTTAISQKWKLVLEHQST